MRQLSLREFRSRGAKALESVRPGETILLSGQDGRAWFLVPVLGDIALLERDLRLAVARASLRESWVQAEALGIDKMTDGEINREIDRVRRERRGRKSD